MITTPTVFILGAGASKPYGFPDGAGLREALLQGVIGRFKTRHLWALQMPPGCEGE
jgi:hypothetical protein